VAQNKKEEDSRREADTLDRLISVVKKGPDTAQSAKVGEPSLVDPTPVAANQEAGETARRAMGLSNGDHSVSVEAVKTGTPGENEPAPRSDAPQPASSDPFARPNSTAADANELKPAAEATATKPNGAPDPNELTPTADAQTADASSQPLPPPVQVNEIQQGQAASSNSAAAETSSSTLASDKDISSSKKKKKKGLKKILSL
jgi:outer membrane protein assembly factor BamD